MRFELTELLHSAVFKTAALNHSATLPFIVRVDYIAHLFPIFKWISINMTQVEYNLLLIRIKLFLASD